MPNVWFTSDTHFGHDRIIQYCERPFANCKDQDNTILERFNSVIKKGDLLYHLGDVCWSTYDLHDFLGKLNTKQVYLIRGNHDNKHNREYGGFIWVKDYANIHAGNNHFALFHYPMRSWLGRSRGAYHLYGHVHGRMPGICRSMDVGVDTNNFYPYALEDVVAKLKDEPYYEDGMVV